MALEDHINTKLETFKTRMKDRLRTLLTEFGLGRSPSPRRSQRGESFDRKENPLEKEDTTTYSPYPRTRVDFP
ncbi:hypothetical protein BHE74_00051341 [Ensete ventricosum]|uniref:Uncharacterized protein n=1 Tax=Ensete ventricosum TaxID=4639 RepID=A0A426Z4N4_ENSVE|nr:hypothetical protein B296_00024371 [Ensete ventricosum]RWW43037.1 hypothetical protein BHE74_00051341 [Ensete ventricosum]